MKQPKDPILGGVIEDFLPILLGLNGHSNHRSRRSSAITSLETNPSMKISKGHVGIYHDADLF